MKRIATTLATALIVGVARSACGTAEMATGSRSSLAPYHVTRDNKAKLPAHG
jgi:hypothetical protein